MDDETNEPTSRNSILNMNDSFKTLLDNALIIADPHKIQNNNACDTETAVTTSSTARSSTASSSTEAKKNH